VDNIEKALTNPTDQRIFVIEKAFDKGLTVEQIHQLTKINHWFLEKLKTIYDYAQKLSSLKSIEDITVETMQQAKSLGFSDFQIARFVDKEADATMENSNLKIRNLRKKMGILPTVKRINTVASEFPELTNYLYTTYNDNEHDIPFYKSEKSVMVLGSGAYRIGSSVEFDWCSVNAVQTARNQGYRAIMINCNPETVSTDYDVCDKLYMDELSMERVLDIFELELPKGVILSVGGQIPNNLAMKLHRQHIPILGTSPLSIDRAENRHKFSLMLDSLKIDQPEWQELTDKSQIYEFCEKVNFPVLIRPSYVLSGAAMNVCTNTKDLEHFLNLASNVSKEHPVVISKFLNNAKELEFDAVARNGEIIEYAISEHIEFAGVHSGDATLVFPAQKIYFETGRRVKKISRLIAKELNISGPFNIQFLAVNNDIKVIECNLRASRSFPFVSKILKRNFIETATKIMLDVPVSMPDKTDFDIDYIGVKASQFSFARLGNTDPILGVDMASTGEVGCLGVDIHEALLLSMLSVGYSIPRKNIMLSTGEPKSKVELLGVCKKLVQRGFSLFATRGTQEFLEENGVLSTVVRWGDEAGENVLDMINSRCFDLVINIPKDLSLDELNSDFLIRRRSIDRNIPLLTNSKLATAFLDAICECDISGVEVRSWEEF
jgi:carbamoyl-phosphate synthase large subunit